MMYSEDLKLIDSLVTRIENQSKVSIRSKTDKEELKRLVYQYLLYIDYFNAKVREETYFILDRKVESINILAPFKDLVVPSSVKFKLNSPMCNELIDYNYYSFDKDERFLSYGDFSDISYRLAGLVKKDPNEMSVSISELKKSVTLLDVENSIGVSVEDAINYHVDTDDVIIPIKLRDDLVNGNMFYKSYYYTLTYDTILDIWCQNFKL